MTNIHGLKIRLKFRTNCLKFLKSCIPAFFLYYYRGFSFFDKEGGEVATKIRQRTNEKIEKRFGKSCDRLQTDFIDLYFLHGVHDSENLHKVLDRQKGAITAFERLRDKGRIGYIGITTMDQLEENVRLACRYKPCDETELDRLESMARD